MNRLRSETTEVTPIQAFNGERPKHLLESIVNFLTQLPAENHNELLCAIAEKIKTKAKRRENKQKQEAIHVQHRAKNPDKKPGSVKLVPQL